MTLSVLGYRAQLRFTFPEAGCQHVTYIANDTSEEGIECF